VNRLHRLTCILNINLNLLIDSHHPSIPTRQWRNQEKKNVDEDKSDGDEMCHVYKCSLCPFDTTSQLDHHRHSIRHQITKGIICVYCTYHAANDTELTAHTSLHFKPTRYQSSLPITMSITPTWNMLRYYLSQHPPMQ